MLIAFFSNQLCRCFLLLRDECLHAGKTFTDFSSKLIDTVFIGFCRFSSCIAGFFVSLSKFNHDACLLPKIVESLKHDNDSECCRNNHTQRRLNFLVDQIDRHVLRECRPIDHEEHGQQNEDKEHAERAELHFISPLWGRKSTFL